MIGGEAATNLSRSLLGPPKAARPPTLERSPESDRPGHSGRSEVALAEAAAQPVS